jgi:hypothetical protein
MNTAIAPIREIAVEFAKEVRFLSRSLLMK